MQELIHIFFDIDEVLLQNVPSYGNFIYIIIFLIIFCETGLVFTPFLPGDSLIFAVGTIAGAGFLNITILYIIMLTAAILGDSVNYYIGKWFGNKIINSKKQLIKKEYLEKTQKFFIKYGNKTIVIARFVPIIRTIAPFLAGVGKMPYNNFIFYNVFGSFLWISFFSFAGYFFGNISFIKENFSFVVIIIIILSLLPGIIEYLKSRRQ